MRVKIYFYCAMSERDSGREAGKCNKSVQIKCRSNAEQYMRRKKTNKYYFMLKRPARFFLFSEQTLIQNIFDFIHSSTHRQIWILPLLVPEEL